jgi:hypothetical protein
MLVRFVSDSAVTGKGFAARYTRKEQGEKIHKTVFVARPLLKLALAFNSQGFSAIFTTIFPTFTLASCFQAAAAA